MRLELSVSPLPDLPAPNGAHELAWSYLLDAIFADAYTHNIGEIHVSLPHQGLKADVQLRAELTSTSRDADGVAVALLGHQRDLAAYRGELTRAYVLTFGRLAPGTLRALSSTQDKTWEAEHSQVALSLSTLLWGVPITLANRTQCPALLDRALLAMRRDFARPLLGLYYYRLRTFQPTVKNRATEPAHTHNDKTLDRRST